MIIPEVKVKIAVDGEVSMEYTGFHGSDCRLKEARLNELLAELGMTKIVEKDKRVIDSRFELEKA